MSECVGETNVSEKQMGGEGGGATGRQTGKGRLCGAGRRGRAGVRDGGCREGEGAEVEGAPEGMSTTSAVTRNSDKIL